MSRRKKSQEESSIPIASAGLLRFYEENTGSIIKIKPEFVIISSIILIVGVILANAFFPSATSAI